MSPSPREKRLCRKCLKKWAQERGMCRTCANLITRVPKGQKFNGGIAIIPRDHATPESSWWASPQMQTDRAAFDQHVADESLRMKGSRFGNMERHTAPEPK